MASSSLFVLAGCELLALRPQVDVAVPTHATPVAAPAPTLNNGAIFQASQYRPLFEDHRARLVGDTLVVRIVENVTAEQTSSSTIEGKGSTENTNRFAGTITATVTGVLPNGHLLISGEKQIGVNNNVDVLRFSGQVDPKAIQPGNAVASAQIANVRLEHRGRGPAADAQVIGWLARFFLSVLPI